MERAPTMLTSGLMLAAVLCGSPHVKAADQISGMPDYWGLMMQHRMCQKTAWDKFRVGWNTEQGRIERLRKQLVIDLGVPDGLKTKECMYDGQVDDRTILASCMGYADDVEIKHAVGQEILIRNYEQEINQAFQARRLVDRREHAESLACRDELLQALGVQKPAAVEVLLDVTH